MAAKPKDSRVEKTADKAALDAKVDAQMDESFPASDPPSYSGGKHIIGAPVDRETKPKTARSHAVKAAEKKVKDGDAPKPETY